MNRLNQRRRWIEMVGPVVDQDFGLPDRAILPLGFLMEFAFLIMLSNARPSLVPMLMGVIWPETNELRRHSS